MGERSSRCVNVRAIVFSLTPNITTSQRVSDMSSVLRPYIRVQGQIQTLFGFMAILKWNNSLPALSMGHEY